ncbi:MAG: type II toxin-antitoxin system HicB family antitoxin [Verrucomicrobia bacterium]|nr:type II toxin-antitoxin system HicB family antitoxin [Verrucomicrobiota bacterium]
MKPEYTAVIFKDGGWYVGWCPEIKGANGQGKTRKECLEDLRASVETICRELHILPPRDKA